MKVLSAFFLSAALLGCAREAHDADAQGSLALSLSSQANGVAYRLSHARFSLEGPTSRELEAGDDPTLELELPPGAYTLTLLDGFTLARVDDAGPVAVGARLVSANPAPLLINPGRTTQLSLRFELEGAPLSSQPGTLAIELDVGAADAGAGAACAAGLRIEELDYDQPGADEAEFVEISNRSDCEVPLADVAIELVNGGDGQVYARYELAKAAPALASGQRLLLGASALLASAPSGTVLLALNGSGLQNGPDGVRLVLGEQLLDAVAYEGSVPGVGTGATIADEGEQALSRCPGALDTGDASLDFQLAAPTPGAPNTCD